MERAPGGTTAVPPSGSLRTRVRSPGLSGGHTAVLLVVLSVVVSAVGAGVTMVAAASDSPGDGVFIPTGAGTSDDPYRVTDVSGLQAMADDLDAHYVLVADVDASDTAGWNGGAGFEPVGNRSRPFEGTLDGDGHTVSGLVIDRPTDDVVGLFGVLGRTGRVTDVDLEGVTVTGGDVAGSLVAQNLGTVDRSTATGTVTGGELVGGLVGGNRGTVTRSAASGSVGGTFTVGGLVGLNENGTVRASAATASVTGEFHVGGLVGFSRMGGAVVDAEASGPVAGSSCVGGLVGTVVDGTVANGSASGSVTGEEQVGGLVGTLIALESSAVVDAEASGPVSGRKQVGGLVGADVALGTGTIERAAASGTVTGVERVGGLVGQSFAAGRGNATLTRVAATGNVSGIADVGGLVGENTADDATGTLGTVTVERAAASGTVTGVERVGGLVGRNVASAIERSAARGSVAGEERVGGLVGWNVGSSVADAYATGAVEGTEAVGALVGTNDRGAVVARAYATGRVTGGTPGSGLVGEHRDTGVVVDAYWNTETTGIDHDPAGAAGGTGLTTARMTGAAARETLDGFDVPGTWLLTDGYPLLAWEDADPFFVVNVTATNGPVEAGDTLEVTATVTNYGGQGVRTVSLTDTGFDGAVRDGVEVELDTGETTSVTLSWTTRADDVGVGALTVASGDDSDSVVATVRGGSPLVGTPAVTLGVVTLLALVGLGLVVALDRRRRLRRPGHPI